jgi:H+/Cl- antiporter ClcA
MERWRWSLKWAVYILSVGTSIGLMSAIFLKSLEWVTELRNTNDWLIYLLPLVGLLIAFFYKKYGASVVRGNDLIFEEIQAESKPIPLRMAPLVFFGTLLTHLVGGSAGREGTAVQMGGAIASKITKIFRSTGLDRKLILIMGVSAGFASIFGTPFAGAFFALEVVALREKRILSFLPALLTAFVAHIVSISVGAKHADYFVGNLPNFDREIVKVILLVVILGLVSGSVSYCYMLLSKSASRIFSKITKPMLRPVIGGILLLIGYMTIVDSRFMGLGIDSIQQSFSVPSQPFDFLIKLLMTVLTLSSGFKGGEVTPLFFIGASMGSALSLFLPLPLGMMAAIGFVAVFAGATKTPIASTIMGMEIFGPQIGVYLCIACYLSYFVSGKGSIYDFKKADSE